MGMTSDQVAQVVIALSVGGVITSAVKGWVQRKKLGADYAGVIAKTATDLLKPLAQRVGELEQDLSHERATVKLLRTDLEAARQEVRHLRLELKEFRAENGHQTVDDI